MTINPAIYHKRSTLM